MVFLRIGVRADLFDGAAAREADTPRRLRFITRPPRQWGAVGSPVAAKFDQKPSMIRASAIWVGVSGLAVSLCQT
jgi:hypothetical protein